MHTKSLTFFLTFFMSALVSAEIKVRVHFSPISNLIYQLDCISNELPQCSREAYTDLWKREFQLTESDWTLIKSWAGLMDQYSPELAIEDSDQRSSTGRFEGVKLSTKIRIASFQSNSLTDYLSRLDLVVRPKDRLEFQKIIEHFLPRFEIWWKREASQQGKRFALNIDSLLKSSRISKKIMQFSEFYEAQLGPGYEVHFSLFFRPKYQGGTSGEQIENYSVAEFLPHEQPEDRIDVIIHELCHFFYENSHKHKFSELQKTFVNHEGLEARGAWNLLNEALATVLGNGVINRMIMKRDKWEKYLSKPLSFYNDQYIDAAAKALLPWMEQWISDSKTLYHPSFFMEYLSQLEKSMARGLTAPSLLLNEMILVADSEFGQKFRDSVRKSLKVSSQYTSEGAWSDKRTLESFSEKEHVSALIIVHPRNLQQLRAEKILSPSEFQIVRKSLNEKGQFIFSKRRSTNAILYIISGPNFEDSLKLVDALAELKEGFLGVLNPQ